MNALFFLWYNVLCVLINQGINLVYQYIFACSIKQANISSTDASKNLSKAFLVCLFLPVKALAKHFFFSTNLLKTTVLQK